MPAFKWIVLVLFYGLLVFIVLMDARYRQSVSKPVRSKKSADQPTSDQLTTMWQQQLEFMQLLQQERDWPEFPVDLASKKGQQFLKDIRNHLMEELFEAGQHLKNAKSHRATDIPEIDREAYKEELVDALHLYFELVIASGITLEELVKAYIDKGEINVGRIETGY
jgi:hypothetical protein